MRDKRGRSIPPRDWATICFVAEYNQRNPARRLLALQPGVRPLRRKRLLLDAMDRRN